MIFSPFRILQPSNVFDNRNLISDSRRDGRGRAEMTTNDFSSITQWEKIRSTHFTLLLSTRAEEKCTWMWLSICGMWAWLHYPPAFRDFGIFGFGLVYCSILPLLVCWSLARLLLYWCLEWLWLRMIFSLFEKFPNLFCVAWKHHHTTYNVRRGKGRKYFSSVA